MICSTRRSGQLFRRLAVFARGCTIDAAEVVVDPDGTLDVFGGIASLVDKSLLRQEIRSEQEPRFGLLETIREYGLDQLAVSGEEPVTPRSACRLGARPGGAGRTGVIRERTADLVGAVEMPSDPTSAPRSPGSSSPATRSAHSVWRGPRQCSACCADTFGRGRIGCAGPWPIPGETSPASRAGALIGIGTLTWFRGDNNAARALLEQGLAISRDGDFVFGVRPVTGSCSPRPHGRRATSDRLWFWVRRRFPACATRGNQAGWRLPSWMWAPSLRLQRRSRARGSLGRRRTGAQSGPRQPLVHRQQPQ